MNQHEFPITAILIGLLLIIAISFTAPEVHAQTTRIANLNFPTAPTSSPNAKVDFDFNYSGLQPNEALIAFVYDVDANAIATGNGSSTPNTCTQQFSGQAFCAWFISGSGSEHVAFDLQFSTHRESHRLAATSGVAYANVTKVIRSSVDEIPFSIMTGNQLKLTVNTEGKVPVTIDGAYVGQGTSSVNLDAGPHTVSVPNLVPLDNFNRLKFQHWDDGSDVTMRSLNVQTDLTVQATYVMQHKLVLTSIINATGTGWYDDGSNAHVSVPSTAPLEGLLGLLGGELRFKGWYENNSLVSTSSSATIQMFGGHSLNAQWESDYTISIVMIVVLVAAIGVAVALTARRNAASKRRKKNQ